jgi:glycosyltransferase involved in cell wall biosynthesis
MRRILFAVPGLYLPHTRGGANVSFDALCRRLVTRGCKPTVVCAADAATGPQESAPGDQFPYAVLRLPAPIEQLGDTIARIRPDTVVVRGPDGYRRITRIAATLGRPIHIYFQSAFANRNYPAARSGAALRYAANSPFIARMAESYFAAPVAMIPSIIEPGAFSTDARGEAVLFVNPVAIKGVHIAASIAERLPHRRFLIAPAWPDSGYHPLVNVRLPNVENLARTNDIRTVLARTRVLLVPSVWEEASARIIGEAQQSGIPAVASDRGGLPESVGAGGIVLGLADPIEAWCAAVESLFDDHAKYAALSAGARAHTMRPDRRPEIVVERFLAFAAT